MREIHGTDETLEEYVDRYLRDPTWIIESNNDDLVKMTYLNSDYYNIIEESFL